jgi:hypothetical protein
VRKYLLTMTDGAGEALERETGHALRIGRYGTTGIEVAGLDRVPDGARPERYAIPADRGGERPERIARVLADLLALTDPGDHPVLLTFAERKVLGAAADLLSAARDRETAARADLKSGG